MIQRESLYRDILEKRLNSTYSGQLTSAVNANIVNLIDLNKYNTLDDIFINGAAIIFIPNRFRKVGHWTCIFKIDKNTVEFFDSYGRSPKYYERKLNINYLTRLINNSPYAAYYNTYKFQTKKSNACGRHVVSRLFFRRYSIEEYSNLMTSKEAGRDFADDLATLLTYNI